MSVRTQCKGLHGVSGLGVGEQVRPEGLRRGERRTQSKKGEVPTDTEVKGAQGSSHKGWDQSSVPDFPVYQCSKACVLESNAFELTFLN